MAKLSSIQAEEGMYGAFGLPTQVIIITYKSTTELSLVKDIYSPIPRQRGISVTEAKSHVNFKKSDLNPGLASKYQSDTLITEPLDLMADEYRTRCYYPKGWVLNQARY